jgi:hypothetical protein
MLSNISKNTGSPKKQILLDFTLTPSRIIYAVPRGRIFRVSMLSAGVTAPIDINGFSFSVTPNANSVNALFVEGTVFRSTNQNIRAVGVEEDAQ